MADVPTDPRQGGQPSEEELRAALGQLRGAPVDQIVAEVASALLNAAQVKLGRRDGRLLIDLIGAVADTVRPSVPAELTRQLDDALGQLRLAQVEAEREVAAALVQGHQEPGDLPADGGRSSGAGAPAGDAPPAAPASDAGAPGSGGGQPPQTSRLWVPGR